MNLKLTRRRFIVGSIAAAIGAVVDMRFIEPRWIRLAHVDIMLTGKQLTHPIKILHLSDMHASDQVPISYIRDAFELGVSQKPDLICITGDFISRQIPDQTKYLDSLKILSANCPCFACAGNHDGGSWVAPHGGYNDLTEIRQLLDDSGISLLFNSSRTISVNGSTIELIGLGDYWANDTKPDTAFPPDDKTIQTPRIVLSHNPDSKELLQNYALDLMLCGHTHGGQLYLPMLGTPFAPVQDRKYAYGLHRWKDRLIYTNRGIGLVCYLRFNCRPEIAILNVT